MSESTENIQHVKKAITATNEKNEITNNCESSEEGAKKSLQVQDDEELNEDHNIGSEELVAHGDQHNQARETSKTGEQGQEEQVQNIVDEEKTQHDDVSETTENDESKVEIDKNEINENDGENNLTETDEAEGMESNDGQTEKDQKDVEPKYTNNLQNDDDIVSKIVGNKTEEEQSSVVQKSLLTETDKTEKLQNYIEQKYKEDTQNDSLVSKNAENNKSSTEEEKSTITQEEQENQLSEPVKTEELKGNDEQAEEQNDVEQISQEIAQNDDQDPKAKEEEEQNKNLTESEHKNKKEIIEHDETNNGNNENKAKEQKSFEIAQSFNAAKIDCVDIPEMKEVPLTEEHSITELENSETAVKELVENQAVDENKEQVSIEKNEKESEKTTGEEIIDKPTLVAREEVKTLEKELIETTAIQQNLLKTPVETYAAVENSSDVQVESIKERDNSEIVTGEATENASEEKVVLANLTKDKQRLKETDQEITDAVNSFVEEKIEEVSLQKENSAEEVTESILPKPIQESNENNKLDENTENIMKTDNGTEQVTSKTVTENDNSISAVEKLSENEKAKENAKSNVLEEKLTTNTSIHDITAVIEIDDDNDETEVTKAVEVTEATKDNENATKKIAEPKVDDIIEIDDDDDVAAAEEKLKEKEQIKTSEDNDKSKKQDEPMETETMKKTTSITDSAAKVDNAEGAKAATIAKMHTMPMIFFKKECINFECPKTHKEYHRAPQFALNYFKISKKKTKVQYICGDCYDMTLAFYQEFCGLLEAKQPILMKCIANKKQEFVEILDSSDEDEAGAGDTEQKEKENSCFSQADLDLIENELDNTIRNVFERIQIQNQLTWSKTIYTERVKKLQSELEYIDASLGETQKMADRMYNDLYNSGRYRINTLKALDLDDDTEQIPPHGEIERPAIKLGGTYYAARNKAIACWVPCNVLEQVDSFLLVPQYRVKFLNAQFQAFKNLSAKLIAYYDPPPVRLSVGQRVIAYFDGTTLSANEKEKIQIKSAFYPGIIAEEMKPNNYYRYLIFYDDGYTQYVSHKDVRLVCHISRNVWEDVDHVSREFIKKYVQEYRVNRPMVQTHKGQKMATEKNGRWVPARVIDIDCSLVRMQFEGPKGNHTEWIYRGSLRLNPVYMEYQKSKSNQVNRAPVSRLPRRTEPFIRYTEDEETINAQQEEQQASRTQNRANSTSSSQSTPTVRHLNANTIYLEDENKPKGKVIYYTAKRQMPSRVYRPHDCGPHCLIVIPHNLNGYSPLAKPLLSGWERLFSRQKIKKTVFYRAPCGKMFRCMKELHHYLRLTKCTLNVDNFDFYAETSCLAEFEAENVMLRQRDISNGQEKIPLPLINYYDETLPECTYSSKVIPTEGVNINTDPNFLICCDCEDDCVDKSKCACWQLTIEGVKTTNPDAQIDDIGYQYKRLYDHLPTGIYECNSRCKCKSNCLNRVVQHSLGLKLQVFKTSNRGWGLRCLNDIPRGSFVCIYAGNLLTEAKANEGGLDAGDEYFAELDYIETVEQLKEGYESDVETQEEDDEDAYEPEPEDDDDFRPSRSVERRVKRGTASGGVGNEGERQAINFNPNVTMDSDAKKKRVSVRTLFGKDEAVYVMDAKVTGNLGRYFNHSCSPNLFVQNVFVDSHDIRFPWVAFFALTHIRAGTELTWNYNYEVGVVPGKVLYCQCGAPNCRQRLL